MNRASSSRDADDALIRAAARRVAVTITSAVSVLVIAVLIAAFSVVLTQVPLGDLFAPGRRETVVDIEGTDILFAGVLVGLLAIGSAAVLGWLVTRRAVRPLAEALRRQRQFVADASHELRTPLAILDSRLQMFQRSLPPDDPHQSTVGELRSDSRTLISVVTDLLEGVEVSVAAHATPTDVSRTIGASLAAMSVLADERDVHLAREGTDAEMFVMMPEASLQRSLTALLDNAVKHSPPGAVVTVSAWQHGRFVSIEVVDRGPGIRGIDPHRVFDRFARSADAIDGGGSARTGFGIGLALVRDTAARYGGTVRVADTSAAGTTLVLSLPVSAT